MPGPNAERARIDVLVNNAGITQPLRLLDVAPEHDDALLDVNLRGTRCMSQAAVPAMRERRSGSVVNLGSVPAQRGGGIFAGPRHSAAKAGVPGLTKAMARELAIEGVRVNAICPGFVATDITAGKLTPEMRRAVLDAIPWAARARPRTSPAVPCSCRQASRPTARAPSST